MQGRDLVVEVVAAFVEASGIERKRVFNKAGVYGLHTRRTRSGFALLQQIQKAAGVAIGITNNGFNSQVVELQLAQGALLLHSLKQQFEFFFGKRLEHIHLCPRQQGRIHLK